MTDYDSDTPTTTYRAWAVPAISTTGIDAGLHVETIPTDWEDPGGSVEWPRVAPGPLVT